MQTYKTGATGSFVVAYQEYDTTAIFAYVWVTNVYCCREAYNCMNRANYLEKTSRLATKVYCAQNVLQFSLWLFFGKFLSSTYLLGVTVKNSAETHVEVFMYKCPLVASPLNWDWNVSDLAELHNTINSAVLGFLHADGHISRMKQEIPHQPLSRFEHS